MLVLSLEFGVSPNSRQTVRPGLVYHLHTLLPEKVFEAFSDVWMGGGEVHVDGPLKRWVIRPSRNLKRKNYIISWGTSIST